MRKESIKTTLKYYLDKIPEEYGGLYNGDGGSDLIFEEDMIGKVWFVWFETLNFQPKNIRICRNPKKEHPLGASRSGIRLMHLNEIERKSIFIYLGKNYSIYDNGTLWIPSRINRAEPSINVFSVDYKRPIPWIFFIESELYSNEMYNEKLYKYVL